ncbi:MAG: M14 metallopeptidase family protein, partial [Gemmatimonadota bacterium]|nr:M14 metallopeptidase family protein [Gemmatimonadota bacterium]
MRHAFRTSPTPSVRAVLGLALGAAHGLAFGAAVGAALLASPLAAQRAVTTPQQEFGHNFGDDYWLANYTQLSNYWQKLDRESDRIHVVEIGKTAEGRPHYMAIVTSPENWKKIDRYKEISRRLALAEGRTDAQARALAKEGKAVVWIDGGLHATEVLGAQQLGEMVYQMVSRTDDETMRFLDDCIVLFVHANPDGNELVADWYMRNPVPEQRSMANLPRLYQKYIGHDNNREFFTSTQAETQNINRVLYHEWFPQILYNHHQSGPAGTVVYSPPLRDPYNPNLDPMLILGLQSLGAAMHTRLAAEDKPGATMRTGGPYDGWWNGGIRNTATFHNIIALLTEMIGSPTPMRIPFVAQRQVPSADLAFPVPPQEWHFRQSIDYSVTLDRAFIDYGSRMRENLLWNIYTMGRHSIERGSTDTWTPNYRRIQAVGDEVAGAGGRGGRGGGGGGGRGGGGSAEQDAAAWAALHQPELRDPRGFIIPSSQTDFPTAVKFINMLRETGIRVERATADFTVAGKTYPRGSFVVKTDQAFRPHVIDMFEPQAHPDVFPYPGSPPTPPYDIAGWTLAYQMDIEFDRILDGFDGPFERVTDWNVAPPGGVVAAATGTAGYVLSARPNDSFTALNRLLKANEEVYRSAAAVVVGSTTYPAGSFYVKAKGTTRAQLERIARDVGLSFAGTRAGVPAGASRMKAQRIGLWDQYGGSMPSGWTRWIMEQFEFPFERVYAPELDAGNLNAKYDVLIFVSGAIPGAGGGRGGRGGGGAGAAAPADLPAEYRDQFGAMSVQRTLPAIQVFIENGGTAIAIGSSASNLAAFLKLPVESQLTENGQPLPNTKFFIPGSVLRTRVDVTDPAAFGMTENTDVFFDESPAFRLGPGAAAAGVKKVAWYDSKAPLRSGWAWGQEVLDQGAAAVSARVGKGNVLLFGPEILQRAQPHGTFKFLFNGIYYGIAP